MAISTHFQDEIDLVDATKVLTFVIDPTYTEFEWSYNGLECKGGSDLGCEYAASELMEAMGFRWFSPNEWGTVRPVSIPTNLTKPKQSFWLQSVAMGQTYGHQWRGTHLPTRVVLNDLDDKWMILNGWYTRAFPSTHRWQTIIANREEFFQENYHLLRGGTSEHVTDYFDLSVTGADWDTLVHVCAADLLYSGLNEFNHTDFDPSDGDRNTTDQVWSFSKAVGAKVRTGTDPIAGIPAMTGVPDAQLGVYAYSNHSIPPTDSAAPEVYSQVALAFNQSGLPYDVLIEQFGTKTDFVTIREYLAVAEWSECRPLENYRVKTGYFERYDDYVASGAIGMYTQFTGDWLVNMVGTRYGIRKLRTGIYSWEDALDDIMPIFDNDAAVRSLMELWGDPFETYHKWNLRRSMEFVDDMIVSDYRTLFREYMVILYKLMHLPAQTPIGTTYPAWVTGTDYALNARVKSPTRSSYCVCTLDPGAVPSTVSPSAAVAVTGADGYRWLLHSSIISGADWAAGASYNVGSQVRGSNGRYYVCTVDGGIPATTEPTHLDIVTESDGYRWQALYETAAPGDPFPAAFISMMKNVVACREDNNVHGYAFMRRHASGTVSTNYSYLRWNAIIEPDWYVNPVRSDETEFQTLLAAIIADTGVRTSELDSPDVVVLTGLNPVSSGTNPPATELPAENARTAWFVGPGTVTIGGSSNTYEEGLHQIDMGTGEATATWVDGVLFFDTFPSLSKIGQGVDTTEAWYMYVQPSASGAVDMEVTVGRWVFQDEAGTFTLWPVTHGSYVDPTALGPGQIKVSNVSFGGTLLNYNVNRYMSPRPDLALMTREMAQNVLPSSVTVKYTPPV